MSRKQKETDRLTALALSAEKQDRWTDAVGLLSRAAQNSPQDSQIHRRLADAYFHSGNLSAAKDHLKKAVDALLDDADEHARLADLAMRTGDHRLSRKLVRQALELENSHVNALLIQAKLTEKAGDTVAAAAVYHRILQIDLNHRVAKIRLAMHDIDSGRSDQAAALLRSVCNCPLTTATDKAEARWQLGLIYSRAERWKDAARELRLALIERKNATSDDWYQLAWALHRDRRNSEAAQILEQSLKRNRQHERSRILLATLHDAENNRGGVRFASAIRPVP